MLGFQKKNAPDEKWMDCPKGETAVPSLAYIKDLDTLIIVRKEDALHEVQGKKAKIFYTVYNSSGEKVFIATNYREHRKFEVKVFNYYGNQVMLLKRPKKICLNKIFVWCPPDNFLGSIEQTKCCSKQFIFKNSSHKAFKIYPQTSDVYNIKIAGMGVSGTIKKNWQVPALAKYGNFGVTFPVNMDVTEKAALFGACFLIGCVKYKFHGVL